MLARLEARPPVPQAHGLDLELFKCVKFWTRLHACLISLTGVMQASPDVLLLQPVLYFFCRTAPLLYSSSSQCCLCFVARLPCCIPPAACVVRAKSHGPLDASLSQLVLFVFCRRATWTHSRCRQWYPWQQQAGTAKPAGTATTAHNPAAILNSCPGSSVCLTSPLWVQPLTSPALAAHQRPPPPGPCARQWSAWADVASSSGPAHLSPKLMGMPHSI